MLGLCLVLPNGPLSPTFTWWFKGEINRYSENYFPVFLVVVYLYLNLRVFTYCTKVYDSIQN